MVLYELYQVLCDETKVELFNGYGKNIFTGYLSQLTPDLLATPVIRIDSIALNLIFVSIDTTESEVK